MRLQKNVSLALYTTLKVGGPARFFCEVTREEEILEAVRLAKEKKLPIFVLGGGSNILVSDKGFDGVVIRLRNSQLVIRNLDIICHGGCQLSKAVSESVKAGLTGLEWAAGIPGTVGGAIRGNAGAFGSSMMEIVHSVKAIKIPNFSKARLFPSDKQVVGIPQSQALKSQLQITNYKLQNCKFSYRDSIFKQNPNFIIISAVLRLEKGKKEESEKRVKEIIKQRKEAQPFDFPSSGSFFKNPLLRPATRDFGGQAQAKYKKLIKEFETDTGKKLKDGKIPAGYLIERAGLKGKKIGGAMVSEKHANFIVNTGNATAENVVMLAAIVKTRVRNKFGIQLREEVQMVGF